MVLNFPSTGFYLVRTASAPTITDGLPAAPVYVDGPSVAGSLQPASLEETEKMPEGFRSRVRYNFWSQQSLNYASEATGTPADHVVVGGTEYEVVDTEDWSASGGYYKAVLARVAS
jgi:hypothetical protein